MEIYVLAVFVLGYFAITIEHTIKIDKLIPALCAMAFSWAIIALSINNIIIIGIPDKILFESFSPDILKIKRRIKRSLKSY